MNMPTWQATSSLRTSSKSSAVSVLHSSYGCGFLAASIAAVSLSFLCLVILLMTHTFSVALKGALASLRDTGSVGLIAAQLLGHARAPRPGSCRTRIQQAANRVFADLCLGGLRHQRRNDGVRAERLIYGVRQVR